MLSTLPLRARVAQMIAAPVSGGPVAAGRPDGDALEQWIRSVRTDSIGGIVVTGGGAREMRQLLDTLQSAAPFPLLTLADLSRGVGGPIRGATELPPAEALAVIDGADAARWAGREAGREARRLGVNFGIVGTGAGGASGAPPLLARYPDQVTEGIASYLDGLREAGLLTGVAAFDVPRDESADGAAIPTLRSGWVRLEAIELSPLRRTAEEEVDAILLGAVAVPAVTGDTMPLPFSPTAIAGLLRRDRGWNGVVMADLSEGSALVQAYGARDAAVRAVAAGADLLLGVADPRGTIDALVRAVGRGEIPRARVDAAAFRILRAKGQLPSPPAASDADRRPAPLRDPETTRRAGELIARARPVLNPPLLAPVLHPARAQDVGMSESALEAVDSLMRKAVRDSVFPGAALAVGRRGGVVRLQGYGSLSREPDAAPVNAERTLYDLASLTKIAATTAAVMVLMDDGDLELDAPVRRYVPEFRGEGKDRVTVRHLLTHTSGLPVGLWLYGNAESPREALRRVIDAPLGAPPGTVSAYSDPGMILLGEVVHRAAERPMEEFLAARVYAPLGMNSTMFLPPLVLRPTIAPSALTAEHEFLLRGIVHDGNAFRLGGISGHAGLFSTARDLAIFAQTMLNRGAYGTVRLVTPEVADTFVSSPNDTTGRPLGWDTPSDLSTSGSYFSARSFGHTGYTGTSLWIDPEKELFVVLLTNRTYDRASGELMLKVRQRVHDRIAQAIVDTRIARRPGAESASAR